jgi:perosamine synthetase
MIIQIQPWIDNSELIELKKVIKSTFVTESSMTKKFEDMIKSLTGSKYAISITNGTLAQYASILALNIKPGDEVIIPNVTFIATANAVIMAGAKPVLCEVDRKTFCIDPNKIEKLITRKTKAIIPVHLYGQCSDMILINKIARKYQLDVIEDAAQAVGVKFNNKHAGTFSKVGFLSFYGNKTITTGEGGVVLTNNKSIAQKVYRLKNHGRLRKGIFTHDEIGYNFSFTEMQAALGVSQLKKLNKIIKKKKYIYDTYNKHLSKYDRLEKPFISQNCLPVHWFTSFLSKDSSKLARYLMSKNIQTRKFFTPLHLQKCFKHKNLVGNLNGDFSISEEIYKKGISLPSSYLLKRTELFKVIREISMYYENRY